MSSSWTNRIVHNAVVRSIDLPTSVFKDQDVDPTTFVLDLVGQRANIAPRAGSVVDQWLGEDWNRCNATVVFAANAIESMRCCAVRRADGSMVRSSTFKAGTSEEWIVSSEWLPSAPQVALLVWPVELALSDGARVLELTVVGLVPWFAAQARGRAIAADCVIPDVATLDALPTALREQLARCTPSSRQLLDVFEPVSGHLRAGADMQAFGFSVEQLLSFCIRWHFARLTALGNGRSIAGSAHTVQPNERAWRQLSTQLYSVTVGFFVRKPARTVLFNCSSLLSAVVRVAQQLSQFHRRWLVGQVVDALRFLTWHEFVVNGNEAAQYAFARHMTVRLADQIVLSVRGDATGAALVRLVPDDSATPLHVDYFALTTLADRLRFDRLVASGTGSRFERGQLCLPLQQACLFGVALFEAVLMSAVDNIDSVVCSADDTSALHVTSQLVLELPVMKEYYNVNRTGVLDDIAVRSVEFAQLCGNRVAGVPATINLARYYGKTRSAAEIDSMAPGVRQLPVRDGAPLTLHDGAIEALCQPPSPSCDVEDLGMMLFKKGALPRCARVLTERVAAGESLQRSDRFFYYRLLRSLALPALNKPRVIQHILLSSYNGEKHRPHLETIDERAAWERSRNALVESGFSLQAATRTASCIGKCSTLATQGRCPFGDDLYAARTRCRDELLSRYALVQPPSSVRIERPRDYVNLAALLNQSAVGKEN